MRSFSPMCRCILPGTEPYIRFPNDYYSLAGRLSEEGYWTSVMHAYRPGFWNRSVMYKTLGFDEFIS